MTNTFLRVLAWIAGSLVSAEMLGYGLHRLLHSGAIGFLSRNHMKHHLVLYGPLQQQRSNDYHDATDDSIALGNIGVEWLLPAALLIAGALGVFRLFHVLWPYQLIYFATTLGWSFLMFSYLHDIMHVEGIWLASNRWLRRWFLSARKLHDIHHQVVNDEGLMDKNFGIGFFFFDRIFGTLTHEASGFNDLGYRTAQKRFKAVIGPNSV
jgi:hypothetical protein